MHTLKLSSLAQSVALCAGALMFSGGAVAAGDKTVYEQAKSSAKAGYDADKKACDPMKDNAKDVCVAEAKAKRTKTEMQAEADWKGTPKAREHATEEIAEADYKVAKERCDDQNGNAKDVCVKEAKAMMTRTVADAKASMKGKQARMEAREDKRDANYDVASEKCESMSGDAKGACMDAAKAKYKK